MSDTRMTPEEGAYLLYLVKMAEDIIVKDFMPNIAHCAVQDFGRLNTFLIEAGKVHALQFAPPEQFQGEKP